MFIIDGMKARAHREVVANPSRMGGCSICTLTANATPKRSAIIFRASIDSDAELAANIVHHAADETKHVRIYTRALESIGQPVEDLAPPFVFNEVIHSFTPDTFHIVSADHEDVRREKLVNFLAPRPLSRKAGGPVDRIPCRRLRGTKARQRREMRGCRDAQTKRGTCAYTREAVVDLLPRRKAPANSRHAPPGRGQSQPGILAAAVAHLSGSLRPGSPWRVASCLAGSPN